MQLPLKNASGKVVRRVEVSDALFGLPITRALRGVIHQAVVRQRANARQGNAATKTRGQVVGSTRKLFIQKGTGRARAGSIRSPLRRGGGIAFGPHPRSYHKRMPKKMRRLALRGALSSKAADERLVVVNNFGIKEPRTSQMFQTLAALGATSTALVVTPEPQKSVIKSARNLQGVKTLPAPYLNPLDVLSYDLLVMELAAVRKAEEIWASGSPPPRDDQQEGAASPESEGSEEGPPTLSATKAEEKPKRKPVTRRRRRVAPKAKKDDES
ncbi:MAG: 50S ribosomal protein L4 [Dehalococcoidia bacterium]